MEKNKNVSWLDDMDGMTLDDTLNSKEFNDTMEDLKYSYGVSDTITSEDLKEWGMYPHY